MSSRVISKVPIAQSFNSLFLKGVVCLLLIVLSTLMIFCFFVPGTFNSDQFMPHGHCYFYRSEMILLHTISDAVTGLSYVGISATLAYLVLKKNEAVPFHWLFLAFGLFIVSCGVTHFIEIINVWEGYYWLAGYFKLITALASFATAVTLVAIFPRIVKMIDSLKESEDRRLKLLVANRELESFASSIAHDLRAPLRTMAGYAAVLKQDYGEDFPANGKEYIDRILTASKKMDDLIQDLLKYSKVNLSELVLEEINLKSLIEETIVLHDSIIKEKGAKIKLEGSFPAVLSNATFLSQVFSNLLINSLKFVRENLEPKIIIKGETIRDRFRVSVIDNGIGIAPEYQERIFKMFERLHNSNEYSGTGIGLAIVKRVVDRLGGTVGVESQKDMGSTFWIELPVS